MKCKYILLSSIFLYDFSAVQTAMAQNDRTPNIIYIMSDDHASQAVSAYVEFYQRSYRPPILIE